MEKIEQEVLDRLSKSLVKICSEIALLEATLIDLTKPSLKTEEKAPKKEFVSCIGDGDSTNYIIRGDY